MKTTMHILFIYLLFYNALLADEPIELHVTFEIMNGTSEYRDVMENAKKKYAKEGLKCYIANVKERLSLRCNDTKSTLEYKNNIELLKSLNLTYKVVSIEKYINVQSDYKSMVQPKLKPKPKSRYTLKDGYKAFNSQNYSQAKIIFSDIYKYEKNLESSYAMALIGLKEKDFIRVRSYVDPYRASSAKASKLYFDSIMSEYNAYVKVANYKAAKKLIDKYKRFYPRLKKLPTQAPLDLLTLGYEAYKKEEYLKAQRYFLAHYKKRRDFDATYAMGLVSLKTGDFEKVRNYLAPYITTDAKANELYYISIVNEYYTLTGKKENKKAIALQNKYIATFPKLATLIKPKPKYSLSQGYRAYNNQEYRKAEFVFSKLYKAEPNAENAYAMGLIFLKNKEYIKLRSYLQDFITSSNKASKLYYDSIIQEYYGYLNEQEYLRAIELIKEFKESFPELKDVNNALIAQANILIEQGQFYQAEELLKENDFENSNKYVFEKVYDKAIELRTQERDITAVKMLIPYVPLYTKATQFFADVTFAHVGEHLKNKNYEQAKNLLKPLASTTPKAEEYYYKVTYEEILANGWESFNKRESEKSLEFFEEACSISTQESCIEGVMQSSYKLRDYKKALINATDLYNRNRSAQAVFIAFHANLELKNKQGSEEWYEKLDSKRNALAKMEETIADNEYIYKKYEEALNRASGDFELLMQYLYFLKKSKYYDEFSHLIKSSLKKFILPEQQLSLKKVKREYQYERFYDYYEKGKNDSCFIYGNEILEAKDDIGYRKIHAWCAYKSEYYKEAEKMFETLNESSNKTREDIYAQFLSAYKALHYANATKLLDVLYKESVTQEEKIEIAQFYITMNEQKKAQELTDKIVERKDREKLQAKINTNYKYAHNRVDAFSGGINYKNINIEDGRHNFTQYYVPLDVDFYDEHFIHYYVDADILQLSDEFQGSPQENSYEYGLGWFYNENKLSAKTAFMADAGVAFKYLNAQIGSTPLGAEITPELTGSLSLHSANESYNMHLKVLKTAVDNSMISFVGDKLKDYNTNEYVQWGRVVKSGFEVGVSYSSPISISLNGAYYPQIEGYKVMKNSQTKITGSLSYSVPTDKLAYLDYTLIGVYDTYEKNSDFFTYGHGGYFSPQKFYLLNFTTNLASNVTESFYFKTKASVGYQRFNVDNADKFPIIDAQTQDLSGTFSGYSEDGFIYKINLGAGVRVSKNVHLVSSFSYETMGTFNVTEGSLSLVYNFGEGHKENLFTFHNGHKVASNLY